MIKKLMLFAFLPFICFSQDIDNNGSIANINGKNFLVNKDGYFSLPKEIRSDL